MILTFAHPKGGTGKTTACTNVAGFLAAAGRRVLLVDLDARADATAALGVDPATVKASFADVLAGGVGLGDVLLDADGGIRLVPGSPALDDVEPRPGDLRLALEPLQDDFDVVVVDAPSSSPRLAATGLAAADAVVVALDAGVFALEGLALLDRQLAATEPGARLRTADVAVLSRPPASTLGDRILRRASPFASVLDTLRTRYASLHVVPDDPAVFEAQRRGVPLSVSSPASPAGHAYRGLAQELMARG